MKSVMSHQFSQVPSAEIQRSAFDRSHGYKTTFDAGYLVPIYLDEVLPGDTHSVNLTAFARLATPKLPIMDNMFMDFFFFFVPTRLVWDKFQRFMGERTDPGDSIDYLVPQIRFEGDIKVGSLADYLGLLTYNVPESYTYRTEVNALPFRAYKLIWNEWFRDENLQDHLAVDRGDGPDIAGTFEYSLNGFAKRGKRHDYFTSCLPWPQKGTAVELPLGSYAPVVLHRMEPGPWVGPYPNWRDYLGHIPDPNTHETVIQNQPDGIFARTTAEIPNAFTYGSIAGGPLQYDPMGTLSADLSAATAATINSLREAFQLQRMFERDARGGTRYVELLKSHFGVVSPDARLQRPEYLGGGSTPVIFHPVANTTGTASAAQGDLAAFAVAQTSGIGFSQSFVEHGYVIGLVSVRADLTYQQGIEKMWLRQTRYDFYWPALSHLGEQAVLNKEIYFNPDWTSGSEVEDNLLPFGYQERYAEYRYKPSKITGQFRSSYAQTLDAWHLSQYFENLPVLNDEFIEENPPVDRVISVPSEPHFLFDSFFSVRSVRPMPVYSVPGLIDHL